MNKYSKEINDLAAILKNRDMSAHEILSEINKIQEIIESGVERKAYRLPYSSNPKPFGERWRTA